MDGPEQGTSLAAVHPVTGEAAEPVTGGTPSLVVSSLTDRPGIRVAGEIVLTTRLIWENTLEDVLRTYEATYVMELSGVTFADVAGVEALAATARRLEEGRKIVLHRPPHTMRRVLETFWPGLSGIEVSKS